MTSTTVAGLDVQPGPSGIHYQPLLQLSPQTLAPYSHLTYPKLVPGSRLLATLTGELLAIAAMAGSTLVGLAIAERKGQGLANLCSLMVEPSVRRQGIASGMLLQLQPLLMQHSMGQLMVRYQASTATTTCFEPLLLRLGWSTPRTDFVLIQGTSDRLASTNWCSRFPITAPYELFPWVEVTAQDLARVLTLGAPPELLPPPSLQGLEPTVSLGLRHQGLLVGWLIVHRLDASTVRYSSLFVAPGHRSHARGMVLMAEGFARQHAAGIPRAKAAIDVGNAEFLRVYRRHLRHIFLGYGESRSCSWQAPQAPC
jgi:GNAT superfamily N-acetyltransferase